MAGYLLSRHVRVCIAPGSAVLLDLRSNQYFGLDREHARSLASLVDGWPMDGGEFDESSAAALADDLLRKGHLTLDTSSGMTAAQVQLPLADARLYEWDRAKLPRLRADHVLRFAAAYLYTLHSLRFCSLESTVCRVERRKANKAVQCIDLEVVREMTRVFWVLRPFFYTVLEQCLLDSLVLIEFLALYDIYPIWVVGVRATPFAAHSWVQIEHYVLNGPPDYVRAYAPILVV